MKKRLALLLLLPTLAFGADYALEIGAGVDLSASGFVVDGGGTHRGVQITGTGSKLAHATVVNTAEVALEITDDTAAGPPEITNSVFYGTSGQDYFVLGDTVTLSEETTHYNVFSAYEPLSASEMARVITVGGVPVVVDGEYLLEDE